jgi:hypothetical protein
MKPKRVWLVFGLVFCWKIALFIISAQPVPANDSFFYDGAVVNRILNGAYCNPSLAAAFPISGTEVFSAYPPLYQGVLFAWMSLLGTSALSAMTLHLVLFGLYMLVLAAVLKRLETPAWCVSLAGGYLLLLTFHDRPDSLAHLLGMLAVYAWVRSWRVLRGETAEVKNGRWIWGAVFFVILGLGTSLQIGAVYFLWIWIGTLAGFLAGRQRFPLVPIAVMTLVPAALVLMVKAGFPHLWAGFLEHAHQTPSFTGWRWPYREEMLKVVRTVPGVLLVTLFLPWAWLKQHRRSDSSVAGARNEVVLVSALVAAMAVVVACLFLLTPNTIAIANYLQPVIVAGYLAVCASLFAGERWLRIQVVCFVCMMLVGSVRAVGMSTWGLACARDVSYSAAVHRVAGELEKHPTGSQVVLSSAFLYEAARHKNIRWIHSDWLQPAGGDSATLDLRGLVARKPVQLVLTQFEYYRRYEAVLKKLESDPNVNSIHVENTARTPAPDASKSLQRVVQNIAWAPVIVDLSWK